MTIAKRLIILLAVPLVALVGLGLFIRSQLAEIESRSRFVSESQIPSLAVLGNLSRSFAELRVNVRSYLLATNEAGRTEARSAFAVGEAEVNRLLGQSQTVIKSMGDSLGHLPGIAGASILADGKPGMILDVVGIVHLAESND